MGVGKGAYSKINDFFRKIFKVGDFRRINRI